MLCSIFPLFFWFNVWTFCVATSHSHIRIIFGGQQQQQERIYLHYIFPGDRFRRPAYLSFGPSLAAFSFEKERKGQSVFTR